MNINQLEQIIEIDRQGTIVKAGQVLHISQPALSRSMQKLEEDLKVKLFTRTKNHIELNENGKLAVKYAKSIVDDINNMKSGLQAFDLQQRTIMIGSCAPAPLWKILPKVTNMYPKATISSEIKATKEIYEGLINDKYQLAILNEPTDSNDFISIFLCNEHLYLSIPPAHPLAGYDSVYLKELNGETILLVSQLGFWYDLCCEKMPNSHFIVNDKRNDHLELVKASALPAFASDLGLQFEPQVTNRINVPIADSEANPSFYLAIKKENKKKFQELIRLFN